MTRLKLFPRKIRGIYYTQKSGAAARGIDFLFSIDEWVEWWKSKLGDNWLEKRGHKRHQYVMARNGDCGPYTASNVQCALAGKNVSDAQLGRSKTFEHKTKIGQGNKGKIRSDKSKMVMRLYRLGRTNTEASKAKVSLKMRGSLNPSAKRTENEVKHIKRLIENGYTNTQIVKMKLCSHGFVSSIRHGRTWRHVNV